MKKAIAIIVTLVLICSLAICVVACKDKGTNSDPLVGKWVNDNGDCFQFNKDGTGICADVGYPSKTLEWGLVKGSRFEGIYSDYWTYYVIIDNSSQVAIHNIETDSNNKNYIETNKSNVKYYKAA